MVTPLGRKFQGESIELLNTRLNICLAGLPHFPPVTTLLSISYQLGLRMTAPHVASSPSMQLLTTTLKVYFHILTPSCWLVAKWKLHQILLVQ